MTSNRGRTRPGRGLVLGVGNLLLKDEGVGVHVAQAVARAAETPEGALPPGTRVMDGGTLGLDLLPIVEDAVTVVIVDAANLHREPGTVVVLRGDELVGVLGGHTSAHQVGISDVLGAARLAGTLPARISLVAIEPADISPGLDLSPAVAASLPMAIERTVREAWALYRDDEPLALAGDSGPPVQSC